MMLFVCSVAVASTQKSDLSIYNIANITSHGPDDGSVELKRYSVDFLINISFHLDYLDINFSSYIYIYIYILDLKVTVFLWLKFHECQSTNRQQNEIKKEVITSLFIQFRQTFDFYIEYLLCIVLLIKYGALLKFLLVILLLLKRTYTHMHTHTHTQIWN